MCDGVCVCVCVSVCVSSPLLSVDEMGTVGYPQNLLFTVNSNFLCYEAGIRPIVIGWMKGRL